MTLLNRIIKAGLLNFSRNKLVSFAAVLVMIVTLSVITTLLLLQAVLNFSLTQIKDKVDVAIYFVPGASEEKIVALQESLENLPEVESVTYTSSGEALKIFRERHSNDYTTIQALEEIGQNPLGGYLNIKAKEISQYESIVNFMRSDNDMVLASANIIDKINYYQNKAVIERLNALIAGAQRLGFIITLLLVCISVIVTFNTIRLTIFIAKEEIGIMRLVGASKMRVRGPFLIEGAVYGFVATILTIVLFFPATAWIGRNMTSFLEINMHEYFTDNIIQISLIILLSGVLLGVVSSFLAVRKYLDK